MKKYILIVSICLNCLFLLLIIRHFILMPKLVINKSTTFFINRDLLLKQLPADTSDIVFFGDSHILEFEVNELFKSLKVKNRGICYDTSTSLLYRVKDIVKL
jgi:hypothetical protein